MDDAVLHMCPSQRTDPEVLDIPSTLLVVVDVCNVELEVESDSDVSDTLPSREIGISWSLGVESTVTCHECVEHFVEAPSTGSVVFKWALRVLNPIGEE